MGYRCVATVCAVDESQSDGLFSPTGTLEEWPSGADGDTAEM